MQIGVTLMFERILCAAAAVATIAGFVLEVWREMKSNAREDDKGRKKEGPELTDPTNSKTPAPPVVP